MYADERQAAITDEVERRGRVSVTELAAAYAVTTETVRRDLSVLEQAGMLRRVHGGALRTRPVLETTVMDRDEDRAEEKDRIGRAAARLVPPLECTMLLDAGSTVGRLAGHLPRDRTIVAYTHSLTVASVLGTRSDVQLHLVPGRVRSATQAAVGAETLAALSLLRADLAFVGSNGVSTRHGLSTPDSEEAAAKRAMVAAADRVVVLADADKLGQDHTVRFADLSRVDVLVTDSRVSDAQVTELEQAGIEVVVA